MGLLDWLFGRSRQPKPAQITPHVRGDRAKAKALSDEGILDASTIKGIAKAREKWLEATQADPSWSVLYFNLAKSYSDQKDIVHAKPFLKQAIECAIARTGTENEDAQVLAQATAILGIDPKELQRAQMRDTVRQKLKGSNIIKLE